MLVEPFAVAFAAADLADLRARIGRTRWPAPAAGAAWEQGADAGYLRYVLDRWARLDWRARERELNAHPQFVACVDGVPIHFVHQRAARGRGGVPLLLTHGWPSSYAELLPLVPLLTDPAAHGIDGPAFDVVIPSLPGYCFSGRPGVCTMRDTARLWHALMAGLGYRRYGAGGGDIGSGVSTYLALDQPDAVLGLHLSNLELDPYLGPGAAPLTPAESAFQAAVAEWSEREGAYHAVASTRPQTLAYGLHDSPLALAAWLVDPWWAWSAGEPPLDLLLTTLTLYWVTGTVAPSLRDFRDNADLGSVGRTPVPTGFAVFGHGRRDCVPPPREWVERLYDVRRWTVMPRGGHFAAAEEPALLAADIAAFFSAL